MDADEKEAYRRTEPRGIDRLFLSLATIYGRHWIDQWQGVDMEAMKATWTRGLQGMQGQQLRDALDYCADHENFVPTLPRFREICEQFRPAEVHKALPRKFSEEEMQRNQDRVRYAVKCLEPKTDFKSWARKILKRVENGDRSVPEIAVRMAREALGISDEPRMAA